MRVLAGLLILALSIPALGADEVPPHRLKQIEAACPPKPRTEPRQKRRVLIFVTPPHLMEKDPHKGYCIPYGSAAFVALGKKSGAYDGIVTDDLAHFLPESLATFDAVVLNNASGPWITPTDADLAKPAFRKLALSREKAELLLRKTFLEYIQSGHGVMAIHYAIAANPHWPEFKELFGGTFLGHPWNEDVGIRIDDPKSVLVQAFDGRPFRIADEIYEYGPPFDRSKVHVLLSLDTAHSNMTVPWIHRKDNDFALAWTREVGKGRLFYTGFGHRTEIYWDPRILQFYLDAIQHVCGDE